MLAQVCRILIFLFCFSTLTDLRAQSRKPHPHHKKSAKKKQVKKPIYHSTKKKRNYRGKKKPNRIIPKPPVYTFDFSHFIGSGNPIEQIFLHDSTRYKPILANQDQLRLQLIYTRIDRDSTGFPHFSEYTYRTNPYEYFYPASCVKLPLSLMTLEKIHDLQIPGLDRHTRLEIDSAFTCQYKSAVDSTSGTCFPSLGHYIKKMMLVSDNEAYNRVYEFLSPEWINDRLDSIGMPTARIWHRFLWCDNEANKYTNPFTFYNDSGQVIYQQPMMYCTKNYDFPIGQVLLGKGYFDFNNKFFNEPKDFTDRNYLSLSQINAFVRMVNFPETFAESRKFRLSEDDYNFMRKYMSMLCTESVEPKYDSLVGWSPFVKKYLIYGQRRDTTPDPNLRIFNIVGLSYGFMTDAAYVVDFNTGAEFMLSATLYVNENEILGDGKYEYYTVGMPFLRDFGLSMLKMERERPRKYRSDFKHLVFRYNESD